MPGFKKGLVKLNKHEMWVVTSKSGPIIFSVLTAKKPKGKVSSNT